MFENETQDVIMQRMLDRAGQDVSVIEGSFTYNAISLIAVALEDAYDKAEEIYQNAYADTCDREHLIRFSREKGIFPYAATKAKYTVNSETELSVGDELTDGEVNFIVTEGGTAATIECQTAGTAGNNKIGRTLTTVSYIEDFISCTVSTQLKTGEDEEDTEALRDRFFDTVTVTGQYGNKKGYKEAVENIDGIGRCSVDVIQILGVKKVYITITDENLLPVPSAKLQEYKNIIAPEDGDGGIVSIGHDIILNSVSEQTINLDCTLEITEEASQEDIEALIYQTIDEYFHSVNEKFGSEPLRIRRSQIEAKVINLDNVIDFEITEINGQTDSTFELDFQKVAKRGTVTINEVNL